MSFGIMLLFNVILSIIIEMTCNHYHKIIRWYHHWIFFAWVVVSQMAVVTMWP